MGCRHSRCGNRRRGHAPGAGGRGGVRGGRAGRESARRREDAAAGARGASWWDREITPQGRSPHPAVPAPSPGQVGDLGLLARVLLRSPHATYPAPHPASHGSRAGPSPAHPLRRAAMRHLPLQLGRGAQSRQARGSPWSMEGHPRGAADGGAPRGSLSACLRRSAASPGASRARGVLVGPSGGGRRVAHPLGGVRGAARAAAHAVPGVLQDAQRGQPPAGGPRPALMDGAPAVYDVDGGVSHARQGRALQRPVLGRGRVGAGPDAGPPGRRGADHGAGAEHIDGGGGFVRDGGGGSDYPAGCDQVENAAGAAAVRPAHCRRRQRSPGARFRGGWHRRRRLRAWAIWARRTEPRCAAPHGILRNRVTHSRGEGREGFLRGVGSAVVAGSSRVCHRARHLRQLQDVAGPPRLTYSHGDAHGHNTALFVSYHSEQSSVGLLLRPELRLELLQRPASCPTTRARPPLPARVPWRPACALCPPPAQLRLRPRPRPTAGARQSLSLRRGGRG